MNQNIEHRMEKAAELITKNHFPNIPATKESLAVLQNRTSFNVPEELIYLWSRFDGANFFDAADPPYRLLSINEFVAADEHMAERQGGSWFVFCDVRDGNYVGVDLSATETRILDLFHEFYPDPEYCSVISNSFPEFFERLLASNGEGLFWIAAE